MRRLLTFSLILFFFCHERALAQLSVDFTTNKSGGCSPVVVTFTPEVGGATGALTYSWDLGNGNTANIATPEAVYNTIGNYTVTLTVSDGSQTLTASHTVVVYAPPSIGFTASAATVCGTPVTFTANTDGGQGRSITGWLWDFGDGTTVSQGPTASHEFAAPAGGPTAPGIEESVALTVTDNVGCTASLTRAAIVKVFPALTAGFTVSAAVLCTVTDPVLFTNTSTGPGTLSYAWDFGDAASSTATNPSHTYAQKGNYTVKLSATSSVGCTTSFSQPNPLNVANYSTDFSYPVNGVCQGSELAFSDQSSTGSTSVEWAVDGSVVGFGNSFYYTFPTAGAHTVTLFNQFGTCPQSASKSVTINPLPAATPFTVAIQQGCDNYTATFTDVSTGNTARSWDLNWTSYASPNDFNNKFGATTSATYGYNYNNYVALLLTTAAGCTTLVTEPVYVAKAYPSAFETDNNAAAGCGQPVTKSFAYTYTGTLQSFHWDFGDGTTSTSATPTHTWTQPGQYNIVFYYTDANGCSGQVSPATNVNIEQPFTVDFTVSNTTICAGSLVQFNMTANPESTDVYLWGWNYGDGTTDPDFQHQYTTPGVYTVTLTVLDFGNCQAMKTKTSYITVLPAPAVYNGHTNTCDGDRSAVTFDYSTTAGTTLNWDFGDGIAVPGSGSGTQLIHSYAQTGVYYTSFTASNGSCSVQKSDVVYVLTKQTPVLSAPATVCANGSLNVQLAIARDPRDINNGDYYDYSLQFYYGDGTPFTGIVNFTNPSQPYSNGAFGWTLNGFQAGKSGLYVVTTSFGFNCTDLSNTIPLTIIAGGATAAVTVISDDQCYQQPVVMKDATTVAAGNSISSGVWDFGDGQTQALVPGGQVSHVYSNPGYYTLLLTAHDALGCSVGGAFAVPVYANGPKAAFTSSGSPVLLGNTLYLYNSTNSYGVSGAVNYTWNFGDGSSSTDVNPTHLYTQPGSYTVVLTASAAGGCVSTAQATIVVQNFNSHFQISASYWTSGSCPPVLAQFTNTSAGYSSVSWDFGDGVTAGNTNYPSHVYTQPGDYTVTLSVFGVGGLIGRYTDVVSVRQPSATVSATPSSVCIGQGVTLQGKGKGVLGYLFDFGDGTVASGLAAGVSHVYAFAGDYSAQLVVTDTVGCAAAAAAPVDLTVNPNPVINVSPAAPVACLGSAVVLTASGAVAFSWSPATGLDQATVASPVASPTVTTLYQVTGTDANGCVGMATTSVKVVTREVLAVSPDSMAVCAGGTVNIKATGVDVYTWIGDTVGLSVTGGAGAGVVAVARPAASTQYMVVGSDSYGCFSDTAVVAVTVLPLPTVDAGPDVQVLQAQPVTLLGTASADVVSWAWTPPDYLSCTDCAEPVCTPKKGETYTATVTGANGCTASDTVVVGLICEESRVRIPDAFTPNGDGHNDRFSILGIGEVDHLVIYDRWGVKVFERNHSFTADIGSSWDGTMGGQPAPAGVYAYFVQMTCPAGGAFARQGTVVLIR
jgi:gliding motility-associated-like protein